MTTQTDEFILTLLKEQRRENISIADIREALLNLPPEEAAVFVQAFKTNQFTEAVQLFRTKIEQFIAAEAAAVKAAMVVDGKVDEVTMKALLDRARNRG